MEKVIQVPTKKVKGWMLPEMPGECPGAGGNHKAVSLGKRDLQPLNGAPARPHHRHPAVSG